MWPKNRAPQPYVNFPYAIQVAQLVKRDHASNHEMNELATRMARSYLYEGDYRHRLHAHLCLCISVDNAKQKAIGQRGPTRVSNELCTRAAHLLAHHLPAEEVTVCRTYLDAFTGWLEQQGNWLHAKTLMVRMALEHRLASEWYVANLGLLPGFERFYEEAERLMPDIRLAVDQFAEMLMQCREYGVKNSYFQDGLMHLANQAWVILDPDLGADWENVLATRKKEMLARIDLASATELRELRHTPIEMKTGNGSSAVGLKAEYDAHLSWFVDRKGHIGYGQCPGLTPVRDLYLLHDKELLYETTRLLQLMRVHDLVVPTKVAVELPQLPRRGLMDQLTSWLPAGMRRALDPTVLVPRLKSIERLDAFRRLLEEEVGRAEDEARARQKRRHEVVWHLRWLPKGFRPSPDAKKRAWEEEGILLQDNQTYVRRHERGEGTLEPVAHQAVYRRPDKQKKGKKRR